MSTKNTKKNTAPVKKPAAPKSKPRTEEQKKARRERDAKKPADKKADASGSNKVSVKHIFEVGGINKNVAGLYGNIMGKVFERVSDEVKILLNVFDDAISGAMKK